MTRRVLALVGCGDEKQAQPAEARALYTSHYFQKKRQWAEGCDDWRILSAEHGLVQPTTVLEPYDTSLRDLDEAAVQQWAEGVMHDLNPLLKAVDIVIVLAGAAYFRPIESPLLAAEARVRWPFEGKRIGEQIVWLNDTNPPDQATLDEFESVG